MMLAGTELQVLVATRPVDFRKQADTLAAFVQQALGADPYSGAVYVFRAKRTDRVLSDEECHRLLKQAAWR